MSDHDCHTLVISTSPNLITNTMRSKALVYLGTLALIANYAIGNVCYALLASFEQTDGYVNVFFNSPNYDVAKYNAGAYGTSQGGAYITTPVLWTKLQGPLVPIAGTTGQIAYATGHAGYGHISPQGLVITTNTNGWGAGPQEYAYQIDRYDLDGLPPSMTANKLIELSFWSCAQIFGVDEGGGLGTLTIGNTVSFYDSNGTLGFKVGYQQPGTTTDYAGYSIGGGVWVPSTWVVNPSTYHRWDITLDLLLQQVSIDIFENNILTTLVANAPLTSTMTDLTELRFLSTPGISNEKRWALDDFDFEIEKVPEPTTLALMSLALAGLGLFRRKQR